MSKSLIPPPHRQIPITHRQIPPPHRQIPITQADPSTKVNDNQLE